MENEEKQNNDEVENGRKKGSFSDSEKAFLRTHAHLTDREIAEKLNRSHKSVYKARVALGLCKFKNKKKDKVEENNLEEAKEIIPSNVSEREKFFEQEFKNSHYYSALSSGVLSPAQIDFYMNEWIAYMSEVETLTSAEKRTLHELIMAQIDLMDFRKSLNAVRMSGHKDAKLEESLRKSIDSAQANFVKFSQELKISRKQRLEGKMDSGASMIKLIKEVQDEAGRNRISRFGGMLKAASEKKEQEWKKDGILMDGSAEGDNKDGK